MPRTKRNHDDQHELLPASYGNGNGGDTPPMGLLLRAVSSGANPEVIGQLLTLQHRYEDREAEKAYNRAVVAAKNELPEILKTKAVDQGHGRPKYKHAELPKILRLCDPVLTKYGLRANWHTKHLPDHWTEVTCVLRHELGFYEESSLAAPSDVTGGKNSNQGVGSTVSYLERYTYTAILGLAPIDDDDDGAPSTIKSGDTLIGPEQVTALESLITETGADLNKILGFAKVEKLADIVERDYARIDLELRNRLKKAQR